MKKKLIEVALPLEAINVEASLRKRKAPAGYPTMIHKWWAQRPLAACRAVLFASLVDDPSSCPDEFPTEAAQDAERLRLFGIIERLVLWENSTNPEVLAEAHAEIMKSTGGKPPSMLDPFCGGGSIPLEAQRLGLEAHGSDLNPVAVLITKALIEIPPKFADQPPVNPGVREAKKNKSGKLMSPAESGTWLGSAGLADDVRYYGKWMRDEAEKRIGHLYPQVELPADMGSGEVPVVAWIWARAVKCPNPVCGCQMPLVRSFALSTSAGRQARIEPVVDVAAKTVTFVITTGEGKPREGTAGEQGAVCLCCNTPVSLDYVRGEGQAKRITAQLMAIVTEYKNKRVYLPPTALQFSTALQAKPEWIPDTNLPDKALGFRVQAYGMKTHADLFTQRQQVALATFSDLVSEAREKVLADGLVAGYNNDRVRMYADAVATYLAFSISRLADYGSALATWRAKDNAMRATFSQQSLAMVWDFAEGNPFGQSSSGFVKCVEAVAKCFQFLSFQVQGRAQQSDAMLATSRPSTYMACTDPPYFDNIGYADLSDFFYVWLRKSLGSTYPDLFNTMLVPKAQELIASPFRFSGGVHEARDFFRKGLNCAFSNVRGYADARYPVTIFYAFKQTESNDDSGMGKMDSGTSSTGWETFLQGVVDAGFQVTATWPMRTEGDNRSIGIGANALASSIVLACRPRPEDAPTATRREFINALRRELEEALLKMMHGNVAPVDLAQATIGPGMAVYSRYKQVIETDGKPLRVRAALQIINQELDTVLAASEGDYDTDTRFCLAWFEQFGMTGGAFGDADNMARAKNTSVAGLAESGVLEAKSGKVRLLKRDEYPQDWQPGAADARVPVWECTQQLVRELQEQGEGSAARLCHALGGKAEPARDLAYRLYSICERKGWAQEALAYNSLVIAWPEITRLASNPNIAMPHTGLFAGGEL